MSNFLDIQNHTSTLTHTNPPIDCLLTFDVEEYFHIEAARSHIAPQDWHNYESRLQNVTDWLLDTLDQHQTKATFFTLGWVARKHPKLIKRIADQGHELACHGDAHDRLHRLTPKTFTQDILKAKYTLEDLTSKPVIGYRAPTFSLVRKTSFAVDILIQAGFLYDSSIQPIRHPHYGVPDAPHKPYRLTGSKSWHLLEIPPLSLQVGPARLPVAGGGYFRLFPLAIMNAGIKQARKQNRPAMLYFHPWEFDPHQPRLPLKPLNKFRTYVGLNHTRRRLQLLLKKWHCAPVNQWLPSVNSQQYESFSLAA